MKRLKLRDEYHKTVFWVTTSRKSGQDEMDKTKQKAPGGLHTLGALHKRRLVTK